MSETACSSARRLGSGIVHITHRIEWGKNGYPSVPQEHIEGVARDARYWGLFQEMMKHSPEHPDAMLLTGHHADDQVETMLLRLSAGSSALGLAGTRRLRRWGMGSDSFHRESGVGWYGTQGLDVWIGRPLLSVPKSRILDTCKANGLDYTTDPTNFKSDYALRNAIRDALKVGVTDPFSPDCVSHYTPNHASSLALVNTLGQNLDPPISLATPVETLRSIVTSLEQNLEEAEERIVTYLSQHTNLDSQVGTVAIPLPALLSIKDDEEKKTLLYTVTRFVSPAPWGDLRAELKRKKEKVSRLLETIWGDKARDGGGPISITPGSGVLWKLRRGVWTVQRMAPPRQTADAYTVDVTEKAREGGTVLWDNRFSIQFLRPVLTSGKVLVRPSGPYFVPEVVIQDDAGCAILQPDTVRTTFCRPLW